jgi:hypothetical protein
MDQYSPKEEYWSIISTTPDYFFAVLPRPAARNSSNAWRSMFDRRAASERER